MIATRTLRAGSLKRHNFPNSHTGNATMTIRLRLGLVTLLAATALAGCGKKEEAPPADAAAGGAAAPAAAGAEEKVVNVYNWSD